MRAGRGRGGPPARVGLVGCIHTLRMAQSKKEKGASAASSLHVQLPPSIASLAPHELRTFLATAVSEARLQRVSRHLVTRLKDGSGDSDARQQPLTTMDHEVRLLAGYERYRQFPPCRCALR